MQPQTGMQMRRFVLNLTCEGAISLEEAGGGTLGFTNCNKRLF
uniref:Uncharacterized protein n=1 Tax=Anguilla anguilla TaxID=7936 RepID=A0A0E9TZ36_ANGAN